MKKILVAVAIFAAMIGSASAQTKSVADVKKAVTAAEAAAENPKKSAKLATWTKLASAYLSAYDQPTGTLWIGASKQELQLTGLKSPKSSEQVTLMNEQYTKESYADKDLYYNAASQLVMIDVTKPVYPDALEKARKAYATAAELDPAGKKSKDIAAGLKTISTKYLNEGMNAYTLGDLKLASVKFEKAAEAAATAPLSEVDTTALYNAAFTAWAANDYERAVTFFNKCYDAGYYYDGGEVFAKLHDCYNKLGDKENAKAVLEEGFTVFPQSQSILIALINYYIENKEDPNKLFALLDAAKQNEPNNASLYYVEGNIYNQLGNTEKAAESYYECAKINPSYEFGYIGAGIMYYNQAVELSDKAALEMDDKKYEAMMTECEDVLMKALDPFEKAFEISKDNDIKTNIAAYLKNIYYRFYGKGGKWEEGYNKYSEIVKNGITE